MGVPIGGGIGVATEKGGDLAPSQFFSDALNGALSDAWSSFHPKLESELTQFLGQGDLIHSGFTLYDIHVSISPDLAYAIDRDDADNVVISVSTGTNTIAAHSTQPTAAGSWADPALSISFGLSFSYVLDIPPMTGPLSATGLSHARVLSPHIRPENLIADIAFFLNDVFAWISGTDYIRKIEELVAQTDFASVINDGLVPLNQTLTDLAAKGYWFLDVIVDQLDGESGTLHAQSFPGFTDAPGDRLDMLLTVHGYDTSGVIEGEVHWPAALGAPGLPRPAVHDDLTLATSAALRAAVAAGAAATGAAPAGGASPAPALAAVPLSADMSAEAQAAVPRVSTPVAAPADSGRIGSALAALAPDLRAETAAALRLGSASAFFSVLGRAEASAALAEIAAGRTDLVVQASTPFGMPGQFATLHPVGRMAGLWADDDEQTMRRRYRLVDVATEAPISVSVALAPGQEWHGAVREVVAEQDGWSGTITIHKATARPARQRFGRVSARFEEDAASRVALNPQPLPPKERGITVGDLVQDAASRVALNPQPLPPVERVSETVHARIGAVAREAAATQISPSLLDERATLHDRGALITPDLLHPVVQNPSGNGIVEGIDFTLVEYVAPVVR